MRTYSAKLAALALTAAVLASPAYAQDNSPAPHAPASPSVAPMNQPAMAKPMPSARRDDMSTSTAAVTPDTATMGHRASKIIGMDVVNDKDQTIGKIDDIVFGPDNKATTAVVSVGGFLGIGAKLVAVPFDELHPAANDRKSLTMQNASKEQLKSMPEFRYDSAS